MQQLNQWIHRFMSGLRKFFMTTDLVFIYDDVFDIYGIDCSDLNVSMKGNDRYNGCDFERIINKFWNESLIDEWTRTEIYSSGRVVWFARKVTHAVRNCSTRCIKKAEARNDILDEITDNHCPYLRYKIVRRHQSFQESFSAGNRCVLMEVCSESSVFVEINFHKLKYKKLSENAIAPTRATSGSVGYDLYSAVEITLSAGSCILVPTDIALQSPPGVYLRAAPRSGLPTKFTDVGAGVIDIDYIGNVKVVMSNRSDQDIKVLPGDHIAQFILTNLDVPETAEVQSLQPTRRGAEGFGSTGF